MSDISFKLHKGEILGIAGLVGAGRTELARAIFGADKKDNGETLIRGKGVSIHKVGDAILNSLALVPEERKTQGVIPDFSLSNNISLVGIDKVLKKTFLDTKKEKAVATEYIDMLRILTPDENFIVKDLSGGNQQKCVLAKWLFADSDILFFDEPTRGIDIGAKQEIYRIIKSIAQEGKAVLIISSELPEIMGVCHRIIVMHDGRITGEIDPDQATQEDIMYYATL